MRNIFERNRDKNNPFINTDDDKGGEIKMDEEINEKEPSEEITEEISSEEQPASEISDESSENDEAEKLKKDFEALNNQYIRLAADFDNYRKRQAQERESLLKYGAENTLKKIIEVLDNFERGAKANETVEDCDKLRESFNLVHKQLLDVLTKVGLETIEAEGKEFDPNFHEAVMQTPTGEYPEHTVIAELQKGYKLEDRVLRPALVNVATSEG